jgi:hypothetical protein
VKLSKKEEIELFDSMYCMPLQASNDVVKHYNAHNLLIDKLIQYRESLSEDSDALRKFDDIVGAIDCNYYIVEEHPSGQSQ